MIKYVQNFYVQFLLDNRRSKICCVVRRKHSEIMCNREPCPGLGSESLSVDSSEPARQQQLLVLLPDEHLSKFVVAERSDTESWENAKAASE